MTIFNRLPQNPCDIVAPDGKIRASGTKGIFTSPAKIILVDPKLTIEPGDEIRRRLPNGTDETFEVLDFHFVDKVMSIPSHYQVTTKRKGTYPHGTGGNYINVSGTNARVNIASHDQSSNVTVEGDVFGRLTSQLESGIADRAALEKLLSAVEEMKQQQGKNGFAAAYQKFVSLSADHLGIIAPFLPALTKFISS